MGTDGTEMFGTDSGTMIDEFDGATGRFENDTLGTARYQMCYDLYDCQVNSDSIREAEMQKKGDALYYWHNSDTAIAVHIPLGKDEGYLEAVYYSPLDSDSDPVVYIEKIIKTMESLVFGPITTAKFGDKITVNGDGLVIRDEEIVIPGVMRITLIPYEFSQVTEINGIALKTGSTTTYDYYGYDDATIQLKKGLNVLDYIVFE